MIDESLVFLAGVLVFSISILVFLSMSWFRSAQLYMACVRSYVGTLSTFVLFTMYMLLYLEETHIMRLDDALVYWIRYVAYTIVFGLEAYRLTIYVDLPDHVRFMFAFMAASSMALLAMATITSYNGRWSWLALAFVWLGFATVKVFIACVRASEKFNWRHLIVLLWWAYPVIWIFSSAGADRLQPGTEALIYLIADICTFLIFNGNFITCAQSLFSKPAIVVIPSSSAQRKQKSQRSDDLKF